MADTKEILKKLAALRTRLDNARQSAAAPALRPTDTNEDEEAQETLLLADKIRTGALHNAWIDSALRELGPEHGSAAIPPGKLTARAARLLSRGRELLQQLRDVLDDPLLRIEVHDPLSDLHVDITSMLDVLLRTVQAFPASASAQLRLCGGLETTLRVIEERLLVLSAALNRRRREVSRLATLAELFRELGSGQNIEPRAILALAEEITQEAKTREPLRFLHAAADEPARFVAAHSITVAQVMARLLHDDPEWKERLQEALLAALLHDVGMVRVPVDIVAKDGPLTDAERRLMERHANVGAHMISRIMPGSGIFIEGANDHHERLDGTGYPAGRRDAQLSPFTRILATCDIYAALAARRPYRPPQDTRTAMTDTLLLADRGVLDRRCAEKLLGLSFYPVGSVVELNDGAIGYVIATHPGQQGIDNPGKPILSLLRGSGGQALTAPCIVNLLEDARGIIRSLPASERRPLLLGTYPELI
jgi:HD-GYP domain-containing protein (c-di-GMP phosphodiesterase class II)